MRVTTVAALLGGYAGADAPSPGARRRILVAAWCAAAVTLALHLINLSSAYDVFVDEISYLHISQSMGTHFTETLYGKNFYIHPPGFFVVEGAYLHLFPGRGDVAAQVYAVRPLNAMIAALTALTLLLLVSRCTGLAAGAAAAALYAIDPFLTKISSWNMLEPQTGLLALAGMTVLAGGIVRGEVSSRRASAAGVLFGLALLTKETGFFLTLLPCAVMFAFSWEMPRRRIATTAIISVAVYAVYPLTLVVRGTAGEWWATTIHGVGRLAGTVQETGLNRSGTQSLVTAIVHNLSFMGPSCVLFAAGGIATVVLLVVPGRGHRLVAAVMLSAGVFMVYAITRGTVEEQMFYVLGLPSTAAVALAGHALIRRMRSGARRSFRERALVGGAVLYGLVAAFYFAGIHFVADTALVDGVRWADVNIAPEQNIATTAQAPLFLLHGMGIGSWNTPAALRSHHADYVLLTSSAINGGYSAARIDYVAWVRAHGTLVWHGTGRTYGSVEIYQLTR